MGGRGAPGAYPVKLGRGYMLGERLLLFQTRITIAIAQPAQYERWAKRSSKAFLPGAAHSSTTIMLKARRPRA